MSIEALYEARFSASSSSGASDNANTQPANENSSAPSTSGNQAQSAATEASAEEKRLAEERRLKAEERRLKIEKEREEEQERFNLEQAKKGTAILTRMAFDDPDGAVVAPVEVKPSSRNLFDLFKRTTKPAAQKDAKQEDDQENAKLREEAFLQQRRADLSFRVDEYNKYIQERCRTHKISSKDLTIDKAEESWIADQLKAVQLSKHDTLADQTRVDAALDFLSSDDSMKHAHGLLSVAAELQKESGGKVDFHPAFLASPCSAVDMNSTNNESVIKAMGAMAFIWLREQAEVIVAEEKKALYAEFKEACSEYDDRVIELAREKEQAAKRAEEEAQSKGRRTREQVEQEIAKNQKELKKLQELLLAAQEKARKAGLEVQKNEDRYAGWITQAVRECTLVLINTSEFQAKFTDVAFVGFVNARLKKLGEDEFRFRSVEPIDKEMARATRYYQSSVIDKVAHAFVQIFRKASLMKGYKTSVESKKERLSALKESGPAFEVCKAGAVADAAEMNAHTMKCQAQFSAYRSYLSDIVECRCEDNVLGCSTRKSDLISAMDGQLKCFVEQEAKYRDEGLLEIAEYLAMSANSAKNTHVQVVSGMDRIDTQLGEIRSIYLQLGARRAAAECRVSGFAKSVSGLEEELSRLHKMLGLADVCDWAAQQAPMTAQASSKFGQFSQARFGSCSVDATESVWSYSTNLVCAAN